MGTFLVDQELRAATAQRSTSEEIEEFILAIHFPKAASFQSVHQIPVQVV